MGPKSVKRDPRPAQAEVDAAYGKTVPDVIAKDLAVLLVGINPGLYTAAAGHHFARPGNRFWPALHLGGFTERELAPSEEGQLLELGCGITNIFPRATARADEVTPEEFSAGFAQLERKIRRFRPRIVAILGISPYRQAYAQPKARVGPQPQKMQGASLWLLPNPSGLNAHYQLPKLATLMAQLREDAGLADRAPHACRE